MDVRGRQPAGWMSRYDAGDDSTKIDYDFLYDESDQVTGFSFSLGTGIRWSQIILDLAYTYSSFEQDIYVSEVDGGGDPITVIRSKNEWKNHRLNLTFTGYF